MAEDRHPQGISISLRILNFYAGAITPTCTEVAKLYDAMLDPLSAFSLASSIVQIIDFSIKLVEDGHELYDKGALAKNSELEQATEDLTLLSEALASPPKIGLDGKQILYNGDEVALQTLALLCQNLGQELLSILETLKPENPRNWIESFRKAVKAIEKSGKIESLERRLSKLRDQVNTRILAILCNKQSSFALLLSGLAEESRRHGASMSKEICALKEDLLDAIKQQQRSTGTDTVYPRISTKCLNLAEEGRHVIKFRRILSSLYFQYIKVRQDDIKNAHNETFEWIFENSNVTDSKPSAHLVKWMEAGNGIYWVSGKAGSGKSTFMKFLFTHARTQLALRKWSGTKKLLTANYFFWSAGNKMQKSQLGLLQSLLYQILRQCPDLIPSTCSSRWLGDDFYLHDQESWSLHELCESFEALASINLLSHKVCLFVDGLDEYDGEHMDIIKAIQSLANSPNIKVCVSSRPWNVFVDSFGGNPDQQFRLQDFTRDDIALYVKHTLEEDPRFRKLMKEDNRYQCLIQDIADKAQGVFLWVYLVVKSLLRGLTDDNDISTLQERLDFLPSDLEEYFKRILDTIEDVYQEQNAKIFLIVVQARSALPAMGLQFLSYEKRDPEYALQENPHVYDDKKVKTISEMMRKHVNARCKDLLEVNTCDSHDVFFRYQVNFLHRTVRDFLMSKDMLALLESRVAKNFDPRLSLCKIFLKIFKASVWRLRRPKADYDPTIKDLSFLMQELLYFAREVELYSDSPAMELLDEFDRFACQHSAELRNLTFQLEDANDIFIDFESRNFVAAAVETGLCQYVSYRLRLEPFQEPYYLGHSGCRPLLSNSLLQSSQQHDELSLNLDMVRLLLDLGADPNETNKENVTVWAGFIVQFHKELEKADGRLGRGLQEDMFQAAKMMVRHGAKLDEKCSVQYGRWKKQGIKSMIVSSASEILKNALHPSQYEQIEALIPECPEPGDIGMDRMEINEPISERPKPGIFSLLGWR